MRSLADVYAVDVSILYRRLKPLLAELALIIADQNAHAGRDARAARFLPGQPVVGLDAVIADVLAIVRDPAAPPVVVIEGMGGLGKTTLAQCVAAASATDPAFAGVLWTSAKHTTFDIWAGYRRPAADSSVRSAEMVRDLARDLGMSPMVDPEAQ